MDYDPDIEATLPFRIEVDPEEGLKHNWWRKAYLARYGRQSMMQWDNVLVSEMNRAIEAVHDLLRKEDELARKSENDWT